MSTETKNLNKKAVELDQNCLHYAWVTVTKVTGSAPRQSGSKMIVTKEESFGTIGGGALEHAVIKDARSQIREAEPKSFNYPLGPLLGQCCGGEVDVFIEPVLPARKVVVFGAGHIAEHLVPMLKNLNFIVRLVDERAERINLPAFDSVDEKTNELPRDALNDIEFNDALYLIVLTHAHIHDQEIVEFCLDKPYKYLGVIGSRHKWEKFKARYKAKGISDGQLEKVTTPIGLDIGGETPFEITISIIAELITLTSTPKGFGKEKQCQK